MKTVRNCSAAFRGFKYFRYYFICCFLLLITVLFMTCYTRNHPTQCSSDSPIVEARPSLPVVKIYGIKEEESTLDVVKTMFTNIGYKIEMSDTNHWNVLWSHTYPFYSLRNEILHLKYHQKVNHFPGSGYITQKNNLASLPVKNIPKSFLLPAQRAAFTQYASANLNVFWMLKNSNHRGIRILNGTEDLGAEGTFVQEFIKDPLLINGKKFDIGVYVMLTSIDPLRVYVYSGDILLRFCKENYFPLNINSVASYVVSDDYLPIWEIPDLKNYFTELNYTAKESLNAYLHSKGKGTNYLHSQILKTIQDVYFSAEEDLKRSSMDFGNLRNFFELVRFDFIADEYLNVYLLEVNMSPNLSPAHFPKNRLLYEQTVFSSLQLVGLVRKFTALHSGEAEVSEKDIQVNSEQCSSSTCEKSCNILKCKICNGCLDGELRDVFKSAYVEYLNRGKFQRAIPLPANQKRGDNSKIPAKLSPMNAYMDMWFGGKCLQDTSWC